MKTRFKIALALAIPLTMFSCDLLNGLTNEEVVAGLKEALAVSTDTSSNRLHEQDGYFANLAVKILLPPEAAAVETTLRSIPGIGDAMVDDLILKMNRAAEAAAVEAAPIFKDAITSMTFEDAMAILQGADDAATQYLKSKTYTQLHGAFTPHITSALTAIGAQQVWNQVTSVYNVYNDFIPGAQDIPDNLASHTTGKALDGLFALVAIEEAKIRNDINHQVSDLLKKVFGSV